MTARGDERPGGSGPRLARPVWGLLGLLALGVAGVGVVLPVIPTTPLVILAAFCFSRGSPRLGAWLETSRLWGPILRDWRKNRAIAPRAKAVAVTMMAAVFAFSLVASAPLWVLLLQAALIGVGAGYVLSRPNGA